MRAKNIVGVNKDTGRCFTSRKITSLSKDYKINVGLFDLA